MMICNVKKIVWGQRMQNLYIHELAKWSLEAPEALEILSQAYKLKNYFKLF